MTERGPTKKKRAGSAGSSAEMKKTSLVLPSDVWRRARIRAAEDGTDFRSVVIAALKAYCR